MKVRKCSACGMEFSSREALQMHFVAKHMSKEAAKQKYEQAKKINTLKPWVMYGGLGIIVVVLLFWLLSSFDPGTYTRGKVHWHADLYLAACGEQIPLPQPSGVATVHGETFFGIPMMHLHTGPTIHIEGAVQEAEDISLGRFMQVIGMTFTDTELEEFRNGDLCSNGSIGKVNLFVNGKESDELSRKVLQDGETYEIRFE